MEAHLPQLSPEGKLMIDGIPTFLLSIQLDCDSCYNLSELPRLFHQAGQLGCNAVAAPLYWSALQPEEGVLCFDALQALLDAAQAEGLRLALLWFASYKNGGMLYAPSWVIDQPERFGRVFDARGKPLPFVACPSCAATRDAEAAALAAVFRYLAQNDATHRVVLVQIDNESGLLGTPRCHCPLCQRRWDDRPVGTTEAEFTARSVLSFHEAVAEAARRELLLPCYMNAWVPPDAVKEDYRPHGGPDLSALLLYLREKKSIGFVAPDIYAPSQRDFSRICRAYARPGNPLYIAEHSTGPESRAEKNVFYALSFGAIGFDPFALNRLSYPHQHLPALYSETTGAFSPEALALAESYLPLLAANPLAAQYAGTEKLKVFVQEEGEWGCVLSFGDALVDIRYRHPQNRCRGCVIRMERRRFCLVGSAAEVAFFSESGDPLSLVSSECGEYVHGEYRRLKKNRRNAADERAAFLLCEPAAYFIALGEA